MVKIYTPRPPVCVDLACHSGNFYSVAGEAREPGLLQAKAWVQSLRTKFLLLLLCTLSVYASPEQSGLPGRRWQQPRGMKIVP